MHLMATYMTSSQTEVKARRLQVNSQHPLQPSREVYSWILSGEDAGCDLLALTSVCEDIVHVASQ